MGNIVLTNINFDLDMEELIIKMMIKEGSPYKEKLEAIATEAMDIGNLKAVYSLSSIEDKGEDFIIIDGVKFTSKIMRDNLEEVNNVFSFVVTCGTELKDWAESKKDILEMYWADVIKDMALELAIMGLKKDLEERFQAGTIVEMNPGSLKDWPLEQQEPFFKLLENVEEQIGVKLNDSFIMSPRKSISGIFFTNEKISTEDLYN